MLAEKSLRDVLAAFASPNPTPGGGAAAACASAMGAGLLVMVATLPKTRSGSDEDRSALAAASAALVEIQRQLTDAIDADAAAYDQVVAAYKRRKSTASDESRQAAIQQALRGATDAPLAVMLLSATALAHATSIAAHAYSAAASDVAVAVVLLGAGLEGSRLNVEANLGGLTDLAHVSRVKDECERLSAEGAAAATQAGRLLRPRLV